MEEIWKDVVGSNGIYQVSSLGRVKSIDRVESHKSGRTYKRKGRTLKPGVQFRGYLFVHLRGCKQRIQRVHRVVAMAFLPNPDNKAEVDHLNKVVTDNRVSNLEWVTRHENIKRQTFSKSTDHYLSILKPKDVLEIREQWKKHGAYYGHLSVLSRKYRVKPATIRDVIIGRTWKDV